MKIHNLKQTNLESIKKCVLIILCLIIFIVFEFFTRSHIHSFSLYLQQTYFSNNSFCPFYEYFAFFELLQGKLLIIILLTNFLDIFSALVFILLTELTNFLNGLIKLFYLEPRPFWIEDSLIPCICATNYGTPSTASFMITVITLASRKLILKRLKFKGLLNGKSVLKYLFNFVSSLLIILSGFSRFAQKAHELNQLIYGYILGYYLYYFCFNVIKFDLNSIQQLCFILRSDVFIIINVCFLVIFFLFNTIHYLLEFHYKEEWLKRIIIYCSLRYMDLFDNESYYKSCGIFLFLSFYLFIFMDFTLLFKGNVYKYIEFNWFPLKKLRRYNYFFSSNFILIKVIITYTSVLVIGKTFKVRDDETNLLKYLFIKATEQILYSLIIFVLSFGFLDKILKRNYTVKENEVLLLYENN